MKAAQLIVFMRVEVDILIIGIGLVVYRYIRTGGVLRSGRTQNENFLRLVFLLILVNFLDGLGWALSIIPGKPGIYLRSAELFLYYLVNNTIPVLWAIFVRQRLFARRGRARITWPLALPFAASILLVLMNPFFHDLYRVGPNNVYSRGGLFYLNVALSYFYILYALTLPLRHYSKVSRQMFWPLFLFSVPPIVGSVIQFTVGGINLLWTSALISILIIYFGTLNKSIHFDYLTGACSRMQADLYMDGKIMRTVAGHSFSGIMIDIDQFKAINDQFGHHAGDEALEITAKLLKKNLGKHDFLARFGGDEFIIVLDTGDPVELRNTVEKILRTFELFNHASRRPFTISLSMGYDVYDSSLHLTRQQFIRHIDRLMYQTKRMGRPEPAAARDGI